MKRIESNSILFFFANNRQGDFLKWKQGKKVHIDVDIIIAKVLNNIEQITMAKRGRKPSKERKGYFYEEQEQAVVDYITATDEYEKNEIFNNLLLPAFNKMIESIINRYKLYVPDEDYQSTFDDTMSFLMTKINLFNPDSGYKAYSYCGTICKHYLIYKIKNYDKDIKRNSPYDIVQADLNNNIKLSYKDNNLHSDFLQELIDETIKNTQQILEENKDLKENEIKLGNALLNLLQNWEDMFDEMGSNKFNKSAVLLYLKENTLLSTKEIRDAMKKFKLGYFKVKKNLLNDYL